jgi:hypothetical protein
MRTTNEPPNYTMAPHTPIVLPTSMDKRNT